ncbi:LysM peptidoglycan-binding domain-containing protein [Phycicoccus flavus]|uniref:LysM peptidoglycan-binding domain-containing protein n=1 Tax=Phycicoccus flavus TaxID=2502783 RepID=UPI000FEBD57C|nr:LysM peptidoglycan-binding domain-containing protein [Phycicoccus flavus]NHA67057.1 LysM peptidoglycan-binding domain-containing protein [Phycicoccus flavus]
MVAAAPPPAMPPAEAVTTLVTPARVAPHGWTTYRVRPGDTLDGIAARHRTTIGALVARNHVRDPGLIHPGDRLQVPRTSAARSGSTPARSGTTHVVRPGETVSGIAARYGASVSGVLKANGLTARTLIHPGDRLVVRGSRSAPRTSAARATKRSTGGAGRTYTVRPGDTLSDIAQRYGTTAGRIAAASHVSTRSLLQVGQRLRIPGASSAHPVPDSFAGVTYPDAVVAAARRNHATLATRSVPSRSQVRELVARTARRHGVDPRLALAISYQESGWNQRAVSPANAVGVMQVIPSAGDWASSLVGRRLDLLDAEDNVTAGVVMLRALGRSTSSTRTTVAAYYQGLASVQSRGMYADTRHYVRSVMALRATM